VDEEKGRQERFRREAFKQERRMTEEWKREDLLKREEAERQRVAQQQSNGGLSPSNGMQELSLGPVQSFGYRPGQNSGGYDRGGVDTTNNPGNVAGNGHSNVVSPNHGYQQPNPQLQQQQQQPDYSQSQYGQKQQLQQPQQQIQQAGYGGASYYYSTTGNNMQQMYSDPHATNDSNPASPGVTANISLPSYNSNQAQAPIGLPPPTSQGLSNNLYAARLEQLRLTVQNANNKYNANSTMTASVGLARQHPSYSTPP